jgi:hypothetical protein
MSIEPEELLEEALRSDLPSKDTESRLRRRLLGAGLAVGSGTAANAAAAAGGAATAASTGALAKAAALSWGIKVGLAAAVAIPGVGLLWEQKRPTHTPVAMRAGSDAKAAAPVVPDTAAPTPPPAPGAPAEREPAAAAPRARVSARAEEPSGAPAAAAPSRGDFTPSEPPRQDEAHRATTLRAETRLLDRAFAELAAGNVGAASALVAEHESRYPRGLLVKERERAKNRLSELSRGE